MPSSNLHNFWQIYEMYISGYFLGQIYWLMALTRYAPRSKGDERNFSKLSLNIIVNFMEWNLTDSNEILAIFIKHVVLISYKFHGDWPHCYKTIRGKVSVIVYAYGQVYACKSNGRFLDPKKSTWCTH